MAARQSAAVDEALRLVAGGMTPYAAAKKTDIALTTIYRALKRQKANPRQVPDPDGPIAPDASPGDSVQQQPAKI